MYGYNHLLCIMLFQNLDNMLEMRKYCLHFQRMIMKFGFLEFISVKEYNAQLYRIDF